MISTADCQDDSYRCEKVAMYSDIYSLDREDPVMINNTVEVNADFAVLFWHGKRVDLISLDTLKIMRSL